MRINSAGLEFGALLRYWRNARHLSQADLANRISTPSRHISFLETGRSKPSRPMISRLSTALQVPFRERNVLLQAAGFAELHPHHDLSDGEVDMLRQAVTRMMEAHEPFPSFVIDRYWNILDVNSGGKAVMRLVDEHFPMNQPDKPINMIEAVFSHDGFRPHIANWEAYARQLIQRLHRESLSDQDLSDIIKRIEHHSGLPNDWWAFDVTHKSMPAFTIELQIDGTTLNFFTIVAAVALPTETLAQETRVETMFPADVKTEAHLLGNTQSN